MVSLLKHRVNLYRRYWYWKNSGCIFIHIPKAAGTSINKSLYGRTLGHYRAIEIENAFPRMFSQAFVFSFVRNPWDRVLSAYRFAKRGRTEVMGIRDPAKYHTPEFECFEHFLLEWLAIQDMSNIDFVFQPAYPFVLDQKNTVMIDFIGRVENIAEDWAVIESQLGRSLGMTHINRTGDVGSYRDAYTSNEMIDTVANIYSQDIELFGYQF